MSAAHAVQNDDLSALRARLDEALRERALLDQRITALQAAIGALTQRDPPARPSLVGHLGEGLPPGHLSPVPAPLAQVSLGNLDLGLMTRLSPEELDRLPFGVVTLDARGRVLGYNDTESRMAGLPREAVLGRNFFTEVAPCARVREFEGRFQDFTQGRSRPGMERFEFVFNFSRGAQRVLILITPARLRGRFHVSMIRREA